MCLAVPCKISVISENNMAEVDILGVSRKVSLDLVPHAGVGDYVLVHAGYAIQMVDEESANETLRLLAELEITSDEV